MPLVVTTWNLQGLAGVDAELVAARVREQGTDILLLQEIQRRQARAVARALAARSLAWTFKHWPVHLPSEGLAVVGVTTPVRFQRASAMTRRWRPLSFRRRIVQVAQAQVGDDSAEGATPLRLVNVHLTPHKDGVETRKREIDWLARRFADDTRRPRPPTLIAGDFNARPKAELWHRFRDAGLRDVWAEAHPDDLDGGKTNWWNKPANEPANQRIDYIWVSPEVTVKDATVPVHGRSGYEQLPLLSDHLPLTATLDV